MRKQARKASVTAIQALTLAKRLERELAEIKLLIRMDSVALDVSQASVVRLFVQVESLCKQGTLDIYETDKWLRTLLAIDEHYLELVHRFLGEPEPWSVYMAFAQMIYESTQGKERARADYVRRNLRNVGYMYARKHLGVRKADVVFRDETFSSRLLAAVVDQIL